MEIPIRLITDALYSHIEALEKRVAMVEKQLLESHIGSPVKEGAAAKRATLQQVPVVTRGMSCRYRHDNEFGVFIETCVRDAVSLIGGMAYCANHAAKIMATEGMVEKHAARIRAADDRVKQEKGGNNRCGT